MNNLFSKLSKYPTSSDRSPFENFTTESFVYILQYSKDNNTSFLKKFIQLLGCEEDDYKKIEILTQKSFYAVDNYRPIPDITIINHINEKQEIIFLIEVKVDANLNTYKLKNKKIINQIQLYKSIKEVNKENVFLLSKTHLDQELRKKSKSILWADVAYLMKKELNKSSNVESFILSEFINFLEENNMSISKIKGSVEPGLSSITTIMANLAIILNQLNINYYEYTFLLTGYCGFKIAKNKNNYLWLGMYCIYPDKICLEVIDPKLEIKAIKGKQTLFSKIDFGVFSEKIVSFFTMNDLFYKQDETSQQKQITDWLELCLNRLNIK